MREVKYDTDSKKAADAFFDEYPPEYAPLESFAPCRRTLTLNDERAAEQAALVTYLRQATLFFPGTFLLFFISLGTTLAVTDPAIRFNRDDFFSELFFLVCFVGFLSFFMPWVGLGDIKNRKHFVIPASIVVSAVLIGAAVRLTDSFFWISQKIIDDFGYAIWLFPIGLIVPFLAKGWVDSLSDS
ncbi:MAG TPA: hypothetical protein VIL74_18730 [Pyrinomonadaceae bacterium]|jgi:hypothetical protein